MRSENGISEQAIQSIHQSRSKIKLVIAMAGNGAQAISELMRYGNGSATLLAQHLLYDNAAFSTYIGGSPDKYVSAQASRQLAMAAYMESRKISAGDYPTAGIGCTSSLVKPDGERAGRQHLILISTQDELHTRTMSINLDVALKRSRVEEEWINSLAILNAVAVLRDASNGINQAFKHSLAETDLVETQSNGEPNQSVSDVVHGTSSWYSRHAEVLKSPCVVCAGSFNPLHPAHIQLLKLAESETNLRGIFELSITNVDKPPLDFLEIEKRMRQFDPHQLVITNRPRYLGKIEIFPPGSAFVMGSDTFVRVVNPRYYEQGEMPLELFEAKRTTFIVAARRQKDGTVLSGEEILQSLPPDKAVRWNSLTVCIPADQFLMDISSSAIRGVE